MDRVLSQLLWLTAMGLIVLTAGGALMFSYAGMFRFFAMDWSRGAAGIGAGVVLGIGSYLLCRNGNDLMDR